MEKYSFWVGLKKVLVQAAVFGIPIAITLLPQDWMNITLGGVLALFLNYVKVQYKLTELKRPE